MVRLGIFGHTRNRNETPQPWFAAVTSSCRNGHSRYVADFGDYTGTQPTSVHAGDLIRITVQGGPAPWYEIDDLTTGAGFGGGSSAPPGQVTVPSVVLGARRSGSAARINAAVTHCTVNGKPISALRHHRQQQIIGKMVAVQPAELANRGTAFGLAIR